MKLQRNSIDKEIGSVCIASIMRLKYIWIPGHTDSRTSFSSDYSPTPQLT